MRLVKGARSVDSDWKSVVTGRAEAGGTGEQAREKEEEERHWGGSRAFGVWETRATVMQLQCGRRCRRGFASKDSFELAAALTANLSMGGSGGAGQ